MTVTDTAARFVEARRSARGLPAYPGDLPGDLDAAYAVQDAAIAAWGAPVVGWKVGLINPPHTDALGARRLAGPAFTVLGPGVEPTPDLAVFADGSAAAEAEFMVRIGTAPAPGQREFSLEQAADLVGAVHVGIEVASSPLAGINDIGPLAVVSDFGNNNGILVGPAIPHWRTSGFEAWQVTTVIDGVEAGTGRAAAFPDGVLGAVRFLLEVLAARGIAVRPGQWISSGAVTGVHDVRPGQRVEARFAPGLTLGCRIVAEAGQA